MDLPTRPRYIHGHNLRLSGHVVEDRGYETPCWIAKGRPSPKGYVPRSATRPGGQRTRIGAHVLSYRQAKGPIPDGYVIDHLCRVPACVNPDHLEAVLPRENNRRQPRTKLTPENIRTIRASRGSDVELAELFGVSRSLIALVRQRRVWADIE